MLQTIGLSLGGAVAGFVGTWLIVSLFGLANYADYLIDLAKISVLLLALEVLPNGYSLFRQQRDEVFEQAYPAFYALMTIALTFAALGLAAWGFFERPNIFLIAYTGLAVLQRYLDCQLQSRGYVAAYYRVPAITNVLRLLFLGGGAVVLGLDRESESAAVGQLLWSSLAAALLISLLFASFRHAALFMQLWRAFRQSSFAFLWTERRAYWPYYPNSLLKRAKDTMLPLLLDALLVDKVLAGLILVYAKSFEVVAGQLRIMEAVFTNLAHRARLAATRARIAWIAATIGQPAIVLIAVILLWRDGLGIEAIVPAILLSFGVYPYVYEILARSDALASERPRAVTASLVSYVALLGTGILSTATLDLLAPVPIVLILIAALCAASISYRFTRRAPTLPQD